MTIMILSGVLGFLLASLIALFLAPPLWRRAVKVTTKRLIEKSPRMIEEGQADRDQMRAEFAVATRKMEVKIDQLKEVSDTQLIELSKTEKKRDRLLGKIESLQSTAEKRQKEIEKLSRKGDKILDDIGKKNEQITSQADRLLRQTEMLNVQAATLEETTTELDANKQINAEYACKEADLSTTISKLMLELEELESTRQQIKSTYESEDSAHKQEIERLNQEIIKGGRRISEITKNLETRKQATVRLRQEASKNKEKISDLIQTIRTRDKDIKQLKQEMATISQIGDDQPSETNTDLTLAVPELIESEPEPVIAVETNRGDNIEKPPAATISATLSAPLISKNENSRHEEPVAKIHETSINSKQHTRLKTHQPKRSTWSSRQKSKPVKSSESPSLAERIRALQGDHPKSI